MSNNAQKTPLARTLNVFAERKALEAIGLLGKALPASVVAVSGSIVTVKFELTNIPFTLPNVTVPMSGPEYIRFPTQVGDKGVVFPASARLGGVSGLGGGTADLSLPANLSALVFIPVSNKGWSATDNPQATVIYGPDGVVLRTTDSTVKVTVSPNGVVLDFPAGKFVTVNGNGIVNGNWLVNGNVTISGNIQLGGNWLNQAGSGVYAGNIKTSGDITARFGLAGQVGVATHTHTQANDGHGDAEQPTAAPTAGT